MGSSRSSTSGLLIRLRAMVSRRFIPPDSGSTLSLRRSVSCANSSRGPGARGPRPGTTRRTGRRRAGCPRRRGPRRGCPSAGTRPVARGWPGRRKSGRGRGCVARRSLTGDTQPIIRMVLDLPAPLGPRKPNASPRRTSTSMPSTAVKSPKVLVSPRARSRTSSSVMQRASERATARRCPGSGPRWFVEPVPTIVRHVHGVAEGEPDVARRKSTLQSLEGRAPAEHGQVVEPASEWA